MTERKIELETVVPGTPEQVWEAIATGPGISSWYVPHTVEEREGGEASASFGPGEAMTIPGVVAAWEPPSRIVFTSAAPEEGLAFEWLVEARDGSSCVIRLVNTGFGSGEEWDAMYDGMTEGWRQFFANLRLHCTHFAGRAARASISGAGWPSADVGDLLEALGVPRTPAVGDRVEVTAEGAPPLAGTVAEVDFFILVLVDDPAPGTALLSVERVGGANTASIWTYLYGDAGHAASERDEPLWHAWLEQQAQ